MSKICNQCNTQLDNNANFCTICGSNNIREENVIENQSVQVTGVAPAQPIGQSVQPGPEQTTVVEPQAVNIQTQNNIALENNEAKQDFTTFEFPSSSTPTPQVAQPVQPQPIVQEPQVPIIPSDFKLQSGLDINQMPDANNPFDESLNAQRINDNAKKANKKTIKTVAITIAVTLGILIVLLAIFILFVSVSVDFKQEGPVCPNPVPVEADKIRIGEEGYGFLTIPNTWQQIPAAQSGSTIQYADISGYWIISLNAARTSNYSAADYANAVEQQIRQSTNQIVKTQEKLINYNTYKLAAYYPDVQKFIIAWTFEGEDGNTHYISVEGPTDNSVEYSYAQSFGICK